MNVAPRVVLLPIAGLLLVGEKTRKWQTRHVSFLCLLHEHMSCLICCNIYNIYIAYGLIWTFPKTTSVYSDMCVDLPWLMMFLLICDVPYLLQVPLLSSADLNCLSPVIIWIIQRSPFPIKTRVTISVRDACIISFLHSCFRKYVNQDMWYVHIFQSNSAICLRFYQYIH